MIEYLYFVKWLDNNNIAEEVFEFFDEAKSFAMNILSQQPEIHQTEIIRNDFGECIDSNEIGKVWSWEELMDDIPENTETDGDFHIFTRGDFDKYADGYDPDNDPELDDRDITFETDCVTSTLDELPDNFCNPIKSKQDGLTESSANNKFIIVGEKEDYSKQFYNMEFSEWVSKSYDATLFDDRNSAIEVLYDLDKSDFYTIRVMIKPVSVNEGISDNFRKPIPEGKTIKDLVEEMEENEEMVECKWCEELFDKSECRYEVDMGWLCPQCIEAIKSRGEELTFKENIQEAYTSEYNENDSFEFSGHDDYDGEFTYYISYPEILEALKELIDDEYVEFFSSENEQYKTVQELIDKGVLDEFLKDEFTTHIHNYSTELNDYFEDSSEYEEAKEESEREYESPEDPDGFYGWDDYYRWKNGM